MVMEFANGDRLFTNGRPLGHSTSELVWSCSLMECPLANISYWAFWHSINEYSLMECSVSQCSLMEEVR